MKPALVQIHRVPLDELHAVKRPRCSCMAVGDTGPRPERARAMFMFV